MNTCNLILFLLVVFVLFILQCSKILGGGIGDLLHPYAHMAPRIPQYVDPVPYPVKNYLNNRFTDLVYENATPMPPGGAVSVCPGNKFNIILFRLMMKSFQYARFVTRPGMDFIPILKGGGILSMYINLLGSKFSRRVNSHEIFEYPPSDLDFEIIPLVNGQRFLQIPGCYNHIKNFFMNVATDVNGYDWEPLRRRMIGSANTPQYLRDTENEINKTLRPRSIIRQIDVVDSPAQTTVTNRPGERVVTPLGNQHYFMRPKLNFPVLIQGMVRNDTFGLVRLGPLVEIVDNGDRNRSLKGNGYIYDFSFDYPKSASPLEVIDILPYINNYVPATDDGRRFWDAPDVPITCNNIFTQPVAPVNYKSYSYTVKYYIESDLSKMLSVEIVWPLKTSKWHKRIPRYIRFSYLYAAYGEIPFKYKDNEALNIIQDYKYVINHMYDQIKNSHVLLIAMLIQKLVYIKDIIKRPSGANGMIAVDINEWYDKHTLQINTEAANKYNKIIQKLINNDKKSSPGRKHIEIDPNEVQQGMGDITETEIMRYITDSIRTIDTFYGIAKEESKYIQNSNDPEYLNYEIYDHSRSDIRVCEPLEARFYDPSAAQPPPRAALPPPRAALPPLPRVAPPPLPRVALPPPPREARHLIDDNRFFMH